MSRHQRVEDDFAEEEEEFRRLLDAVPPPSPPDGGWGWVIVLCSFGMNLIVDGVCYSYGILMPVLMDSRKSNNLALFSLGGALLLGTYMMSGPIACALCNRFTSRRVAILGCTITVLSMLFTHAVDSDSVFVLLFGLLSGAGFGFMFLAGVLVVGLYFEKRRSVAATMAMCGSSVGMALLAPLTVHLLDEYGCDSGVLMLTGVIAQGFVLAALLKPIDADLQLRKKMVLKRMEEDKRIGPQTCIIIQRLIEEKRHQKTISSGSLNNAIITRDNVFIKAKDLHKHSLFSKLRLSSSSISGTPRTSRNNTPQLSRKHPQIMVPPSSVVTPIAAPAASSAPPSQQPIIIISDDTTPSAENSPLPMRARSRSTSPSNDLRRQVLLSGLKRNTSAKSLNMAPVSAAAVAGNGNDPGAGREFSSMQDMIGTMPTAQQENMVRLFLNTTPDVDRPMYRQDILYTGSVPHLPQYTNHNIDEYIASITNVPVDMKSQTDCWSRLHFLPKSMLDVMKALFNTDTCKSPTFVLLAFSSTLTMLGYYIPFLLLPMFAMPDNPDYSDQLKAAFLLSILGASNTIGRVVAGILGTKNWVDSLVINNIALLIAGGATMALPFCDTFPIQALYAVVFGVCVAAFSSLRSILVVELIGLDKLTTCFNQLVIFHGLAVIIGTPLACYTRDVRGTFDMAFYIAGGAIFMSGLLSLPLRKLSEYEKKRQGLLQSVSSSEDDMKKSALIKPQAIEMVAIHVNSDSKTHD